MNTDTVYLIIGAVFIAMWLSGVYVVIHFIIKFW